MKNHKNRILKIRIEKLLGVIRPRLSTLIEAKELLDYVIGDLPNQDYSFEELFIKDINLNRDNSLAILREFLKQFNKINTSTFNEDYINSIVLDVASSYGVKRGSVLWLLRLAISSKLVALPVYESIIAIGKITTQKRIKFAINKLQESK